MTNQAHKPAMQEQLRAQSIKRVEAYEIGMEMIDELRSIILALKSIAEANSDAVAMGLAVVGGRLADAHHNDLDAFRETAQIELDSSEEKK
jgi:hypothetical protein